jgi:hypothetical protein
MTCCVGVLLPCDVRHIRSGAVYAYGCAYAGTLVVETTSFNDDSTVRRASISAVACDTFHGILCCFRRESACDKGDVMTKKQKPSGGVRYDESGQRKWVWQGGAELSTVQVRALGEDLSLDQNAAGGELPTSDPYNRDGAPGKPAKRRTLDDMRKLSEQIQTAKQGKRER